MSKQQEKFIFRLIRQNENPTIKGRKHPFSLLVPAYDEVYDEKTEKTRIIQFVRGEESIYLDEHKNDNTRKKRENIVFTNGMKIIDYKEKTLLEFIRATNKNKDCKHRMDGTSPVFYEYKPGEAEKTTMKKDKVVMDAKLVAYNLKFKDMMAYARVMRIPTDGREADEIRYNLSVLAEKDPSAFMKGLKSPNTNRVNNVLEAIEKGILNRDSKNRSIKWANNDATILTAPVGQDEVNHFVEWTFGNVEGEEAYAAILTQLNINPEDKILTSFEENVVDMDGVTLIEKAIEKGVIVKEVGGMLMFEDKKLIKGVNPCARKVDKDPKLKTAIQAALSE